MASRTARSVDRTVDKMLKRMAQTRPSAGSAGSASSAAQAIERMAEIQKRIARGEMEAAQFLIEKASQPKTAEAVAEDRREKIKALRSQADANGGLGSSKNLLAAIAAGVLLLLVLGLFGISSLFAGHTVSGSVMLDRKPLSKVELAFHPKSGTRAPIRVTTSERGTFRVSSLPAGEYAIFVAPSDGHTTLPKKYLSPESTPFRLKLTNNRSDLRMLAVSDGK